MVVEYKAAEEEEHQTAKAERRIVEVERRIVEVEHCIAEVELHIAEVELHIEEVEHHTAGAAHHTEEVAAAVEEPEKVNQIRANLPLVEAQELELEEVVLRGHPVVEEDGCNFAGRLGCYRCTIRPRAQDQLCSGFHHRDRAAGPTRHVGCLHGLA